MAKTKFEKLPYLKPAKRISLALPGATRNQKLPVLPVDFKPPKKTKR